MGFPYDTASWAAVDGAMFMGGEDHLQAYIRSSLRYCVAWF